MHRKAAVTLVALSFTLAACQTVIGEDFSQTAHYCDPFTSGGCPAGQGCIVGTDVKPVCAAEGSGVGGESCPCARGNTCISLSTGTSCHPFCHPNGDPSECPSSYCGSIASIDQQPYGACFANCDLAHPRAAQAPFGNCSAGEACRFTTTVGRVGCFGAGSLGEGNSCATPSECASGLQCVADANGYAFCARFCRVALGTADCPSGNGCSSFAPPEYIEGVEFGSCRL